MAVYTAGSMIKTFREQKGTTKSQLCGNLIAVSTLTRIESGEINPSNYVFNVLMERLGYDPSKYSFNAASEAEVRFLQNCENIKTLIMNEEYDEAEKFFPQLEKAFKDEEKDTKYDNSKSEHKIKLQMVLDLKASIAIGQYQDSDDILETLKHALSLTVNDIKEDKIHNIPLSYTEITLIDMMAIFYYRKGESDRAINLLYSLKSSMDKFCVSEYEKAKAYTLVLCNLSKYLGLQKKYREGLYICDEAIKSCQFSKRFHVLPQITFNKAYISYFSDKDSEEYKELIIHAYYGSLLHGDKKTAKGIKRISEEKLNFKI